MCLTIPKKIISIQDNKAITAVPALTAVRQAAGQEFDNKKQEVDCSLVNNIQPGDYIISQSGHAIRKIDSQNAREILELIR